MEVAVPILWPVPILWYVTGDAVTVYSTPEDGSNFMDIMTVTEAAVTFLYSWRWKELYKYYDPYR